MTRSGLRSLAARLERASKAAPGVPQLAAAARLCREQGAAILARPALVAELEHLDRCWSSTSHNSETSHF